MFILFFLCSIAFGSQTAISKNEIVFPVGKVEIEKFLNLLKQPENKKVVGLNEGKLAYQEIPQEGSAVFSIGSNDYMLYWDDFNNDKKKEFLVIYLHSGSGDYSGVLGAYSLVGKKLVNLKFDEVVVSNLFPGKDMSRFHSYLARPFAVRNKGQTFLQFLDDPKQRNIFPYIWNGQKFSKAAL